MFASFLFYYLIFSVVSLIVTYDKFNWLFYKPKQLKEIPSSLKHAYDEQMHALLLRASPEVTPKGTILYFHSRLGCVFDYIDSVEWLTHLGYTVAMMEYPGYAITPRKPTKNNIYQASLRFFNWATENLNPPFFILGQSLGGNISLYAYAQQTTKEIRGIVIEGTFYSYLTVARFWIQKKVGKPFAPFMAWWGLNNDHSAALVAHKIHIPILILHAQGDPIVPIAEGRKLFSALASQDKYFISIPSDCHLGHIKDTSKDTVLDFLNRCGQ